MNRIIKPLKNLELILKVIMENFLYSYWEQNHLNQFHIQKIRFSSGKSAIMIAALKARGETKLKCLPSRNHTELMFKNIFEIPIKIQKKKF